MPSNGVSEEWDIGPLLTAILEKYGFDLTRYARNHTERRVRRIFAASRIDTIEEFERRVLTDPEYYVSFLTQVTVHVTELFRDPTFYLALREHVVPALRTYPFLKIWLAGCATGEEAYALAILLQEEGLYDRAQIYATDLSPAALERARNGIYSVQVVRRFIENYQKSGGLDSASSYFQLAYDRIAMSEAIKRNILFFEHDLIADRVFGEMQVVFCRNVLIYFTRPQRDQIVERLHESLCHGGFLCLGSSERLLPRELGSMFKQLRPPEPIYKRL